MAVSECPVRGQGGRQAAKQQSQVSAGSLNSYDVACCSPRPGSPRSRSDGCGLVARRSDDAEAGHRVAVMAKPVLLVVDDEDTSLQALTLELESRYGAHYQVVSGSSAEVALAQLAELKAAGADVPLVLADQQMPGIGGTQLLARVRQFFPAARRGLLITWADMTAPAPFLEAAALGWLEFYLIKPTRSPDEGFHRVITESLDGWWREQGGRSEGVAVTLIGDEPSTRVHDLRDLLARN